MLHEFISLDFREEVYDFQMITWTLKLKKNKISLLVWTPNVYVWNFFKLILKIYAYLFWKIFTHEKRKIKAENQ